MRKKRTEIVVELDEVFVIRRRHQPISSAWCNECEEQVPMLTPDEAATIIGLSSRLIYRCVEAGRIHFSETAEGHLLICQRSLSKVAECRDDFDNWPKRRPNPSADGLLRPERLQVSGAATNTGSGITGASSLARDFDEKIKTRRSDMTVYMVERDLPGITMDQLAAAQKAAIEKGQEFTANGKEVRYLRSIFVPGDSRCMCLFEASSPEVVKEVNEAAEIPFTQIKEALDLTP